MWCAVFGWCVSVVAFALSLLSISKVRSNVTIIATWLSGIYCVPILFLVLFKVFLG